MPGTAKRTVANPRSRIERASGSGGGVVASTGISQDKLGREMQRVLGKATKMNNDLMEFNTPKTAWGAIKQGRVQPEHAVELAYNLRLIPDQMSSTANQAMELIKQAATSPHGSFDVVAANQVPQHQVAPVKVDNTGMRPLNRDERRHAKKLGLEAADYLTYIRNNPVMVPSSKPKLRLTPMKTGQGNDAFTGNGLQQPNQVGRDEDQKEEMRSLPRQEKYEHQNRASDTIQTDSDNAPVSDGHGAPTRHARETSAERVARLQRELEEAQLELRQSSYVEKIHAKIGSLDEGQLAEVEAVIDDLLYAEGSSDNVKVSEPAPVSKVAQGEVVSQDQIDKLLENFEHGNPQDN